MAIQKVIALDAAGLPAEITPNIVSAGAADSGKIPALNAAGVIDLTMMPAGIGPDQTAVLASEVVAAGAIVNVYNNAGVSTQRNADNTGASRAKSATGWSPNGTASAAVGAVQYNGIIPGLVGLTIGAPYFLGVAGAITAVPPAAGAGATCQLIGYALTATSLQFSPGLPYLRP